VAGSFEPACPGLRPAPVRIGIRPAGGEPSISRLRSPRILELLAAATSCRWHGLGRFVVGTERDHIAPWQSTFKLHLLDDGELTFVLTSRGHNAGIVSKPGHPHRHFRIHLRAAGASTPGPDEWEQSTKMDRGGSSGASGSTDVPAIKLIRLKWARLG
jgi:hypothetical protein